MAGVESRSNVARIRFFMRIILSNLTLSFSERKILLMIKSILSQLLTFLVGLSILAIGSYFILPSLEKLEGKCFYYPSDGVQRDFKRGKFYYLKVVDKDAFRYHVKYFDLVFDKSFKITKRKSSATGTLSHIFNQRGYMELKCPGVVGEILNFK
jgi:hypothetical protein